MSFWPTYLVALAGVENGLGVAEEPRWGAERVLQAAADEK
jgi:hypothetical protein